jgi:UDP-glucose:(heptosyl)LPS alpha-1,3-glucosyltransferase
MTSKPRIAVVSPFLDKLHGTELCVAEQIERLSDAYEIHLYSTKVRDLDLSKIVWHRIPGLSAPHFVAYIWFFLANHVRRFWDRHILNRKFDLVFSPGINCFDADVVAVHIVFAEYYRSAHRELGLFRTRIGMWPWLIHRRLTYKLFIALERRVYSKERSPLIVISRKMENDLALCFGRTNNLHLLYHGIDPAHMNPATRESRRTESRRNLGIPPEAFAILIFGNDWMKKGLYTLIEAIGCLNNANLWLLVRGRDDSSSCDEALRQFGLKDRVRFLPAIPLIEVYYAAGDLYAGPSLEDSFAIPPLEAMACGLPVIVSRRAGVSELITHGENGLILDDPRDVRELANLIDVVYKNPDLRQKLGRNAATCAKQYTWQRNADGLKEIIDKILECNARVIETNSQELGPER